MSKKEILILGDDQDCIRQLRETFEGDFSVTALEKNAEKIEFIIAHRKSLSAIFFVQNKDSTSKFSTLTKMRELDLSRSIPTFLIINSGRFEVIDSAFEKGVIDVIEKPFNKKIIHSRVSNIVALFENKKHMEKFFNEQSAIIDKQLKELRKNQWDIIETLGNALESRDLESGDHVFRVKSITRTLALDLAVKKPQYMLNTRKIDLITLAAVLHDIGKIAIPDSILQKPGRLTKEEFDIMKTHTTEGCKIIDSIPDFQDSEMYPYCYYICRYHHERWDGRGYPDGLSGNTIPISAQLVGVADVYDALLSKRVYKPEFTHEKAKEMILNGECGVFNPDVMDSFKATADKIYEEYYLKGGKPNAGQ